MVAFGVFSAPTDAAELSPAERRITAAVDAGVPGSLELLERTVNINSGTLNFGGVKEVGHVFMSELESLGFEARWVDGKAWGRAGHVVAERRGVSPKVRVLVIGHIDTVFEPDSPFQTYTDLGDGRATGPGVTDMKGGNVIMLLALRALESAQILDELHVAVVLTGDEERMGVPAELARRDLLAAADTCDVAIGFEDGDGNPATAVIARRSSSRWMLRTSGRPAHSSQVFREDIGSGAVYEASRILTAFHESLRGEEYLTFNPGLILGGTTISIDGEGASGAAAGKTNVIAESTFVAGDLRALSLDQRSRAEATMSRIVTEHLPQTGATIEFQHKYPPLAPTDGNRELLRRFDEASRDLGFGAVAAVDPARAGAADVSFVAGRVEMAMDGVGLMGSGGHTVDEVADLSTLPMQAKRVAVMLARMAAD